MLFLVELRSLFLIYSITTPYHMRVYYTCLPHIYPLPTPYMPVQVLAATLCRTPEHEQFTSQTASPSQPVPLALSRIFDIDHPALGAPFFLSCVRDQPSLE